MKTTIQTLEQQITDAQQRLDSLCHTSAEPHADPLRLLPQALEELSNALEELHVSADELQARNEDLALTRDAVERERQRYLDLFEFAPDAYLVTDALGIIVEANQAAAALFRRRQHFLVGKPLSVFVTPAGHADFYATLSIIQRGAVDRIEDKEIDLLLHDGAHANVGLTAAAVRDRSGQVSGIRWLLRDVTERKRAEKRRAERAQLAAFGSAVGVALTESAPVRETVQRCAEAMVEHLGAALARIWTMNAAEQVLELQASAGLSTHIDGAHGRIPLGELNIGLIAEERRPHLTNDIIHAPRIHDQAWVRREGLVAFAGYPLILENALIGVMALFARRTLGNETLEALETVAREIALGIEHKRNEQHLAETKRELELIMETVPDVIYTLDAETRLIRWNRKLETATGLSPQEMAGRRAESFFPDATHAVVIAAIQQAFTTGYAEVEVDLRRKDGSTIPYHWTAAPITDTDGRVIGLAGTGHDITHRQRNELQVLQLSRRLIQLQDEERRRLGRELHDGTAQNLAGLAMDLEVVSQGRDRLTRAQRRALTEGVELVGQCLAEIRTLSYLLHPPLLDEVGLAAALRWYVEGLEQRSGLHVDLAIAPELGRLPAETEIALFRIVQECLTNAHRHSGSPTVAIQILCDSTTLTLEVSDEGRGLEAANEAPPFGVGIMGMRERLKQLGGQLDIIPRSPGLAVRATVPLNEVDT